MTSIQTSGMKHIVKIIILLITLVWGVPGSVLADNIPSGNILKRVLPNESVGTITIGTIEERKVNVTISLLNNNYTITEQLITVEKMVDPTSVSQARRRVPSFADLIPIQNFQNNANGTFSFYFIVPDGYDGAYVTAEFVEKSADDYTLITSLSDITNNLSGKYRLAADIVASDGILGEFTGQLDGNFHKIYSLSKPLFESTNGAHIFNLMLEDISVGDIDNGDGNVGAITKKADGNTRIYNCGILSGSVSGTGKVGGLVGLLDGKARVINCFSYANVSGGSNSNVGGIVGYNNYASKADDIRTMVMNCMFYGNITSGGNISPVYGGLCIDNLKTTTSTGLNTFNYYRYESPYSKSKNITAGKYNCALAVEEEYLTRIEIYRQLLNSNRKLAAWYVFDSYVDDANTKMAKWVLETADQSNNDPKPYPVLKTQGFYHSIVNYDAAHAPETSESQKSLTINVGTSPLRITGKDPDHFNYNYHKVQLPYYDGNDNYKKVGDNYKVVTGWEVSFTGSTSFGTASYDSPNYNLADRKAVNGRVYSQGAYLDVPEGVSEITLTPHWANAVFVSDANLDKVYSKKYCIGESDNALKTPSDVTYHRFDSNDNGYDCTVNGIQMKVFTDISKAIGKLSNTSTLTVYDQAVVLVGNLHLTSTPSSVAKPFTIMSADFDQDHEPDFSLIYTHPERNSGAVSPIRFDFLNMPGFAMAQKPNGASNLRNVSIFKPSGWFEVTNTCLLHMVQFEYDNGSKSAAPVILLGGKYDQFVSTQSSTLYNSSKVPNTTYIYIGGNAWFKEFGNGTHSDGWQFTPHVPVSVSGGYFEKFYLSGTYRPDAKVEEDNAECYISGGKFGELAGAGQQQIDGDVNWDIDYADIDEFYGGGINGGKPITGNINIDINKSNVKFFCGGPKFGDMQKKGSTTITWGLNKEGSSTASRVKQIDADREVTTNATGCTFGNFYGAGYGGNSYYRVRTKDTSSGIDWSSWQSDYTGKKGKYIENNNGIATDFDYEYFIGSNGAIWGRFYVQYAAFSMAQTNNVTSTLDKCIITGDFYGGGCRGKVDGKASSTLIDCTVDGNVFGGGYSASVPTIDVRSGGFDGTNNIPSFNADAGVFNKGVPTEASPYTWTKGTLTDGSSALSGTNKITTDIDLSSLGQVKETDLKVQGNTTVRGLINGSPTGGVFGGGDASAVYESTKVTISPGETNTEDKPTIPNVFGGGNKAGVYQNTVVELEDGTITNDIYGGCNTVGTIGGNTSLQLTGGTIGGSVFGGGKGQPTLVNGHVTVNVGKVDGETKVGSTIITGDVYGGSALGNVNAKTNEQGTLTHSGNDNESNPFATKVNLIGGTVNGSVYGGGFGQVADANNNVAAIAANVYGPVTVTTTGGKAQNVFGCNNLYGAPQQTVAVNINGSDAATTEIPNPIGNVYGGGNQAAYAGSPTVTMTGGTVNNVFGGGLSADVGGSVIVNIQGGTVTNDVYGGGALANSNTNNTSDPTVNTTTVNLLGGEIHGDAYGGGLGRLASDDLEAVEAKVFGNVLVELNNNNNGLTADGTKSGCVVSRIFGANNVNGSPKGNVTVHVFGTQHKDATTIGTKLKNANADLEKGTQTDEQYLTVLKGVLADMITKAGILNISVTNSEGTGYQDIYNNNSSTADDLKAAIKDINDEINAKVSDENTSATNINTLYARIYDVKAVYGGGNEAAYIPTTAYHPTNASTGSKTQVIIEGCDETSIETVYGGGNAASVPETNVDIKSAHEIQAVFGGGNGKDNTSYGANPGADVGVYNNGSADVEYGTGNATTLLEGGYIHEAYGASNSKGNIKGNVSINTNPSVSCNLKYDKLVGAGKNADVDHDVIMVLGCNPTTKNPLIFGGADNANVNGNVELTITSGTFGQVFGGNNLGGIIKGHIKVNIEETECTPIRIDELYLGGNQAAYSSYGYYKDGEVYKPRTAAMAAITDPTAAGYHAAEEGNHSAPYAQPELNVISCTYIGKVFGGGYGERAILYGNPTVNINMIPGRWASSELGVADKLGEIVDVFGGGNQAKVEGNTTVNIGTVQTVGMVTAPTYLGETAYTKNTTTGLYEVAVQGANIIGNVYGGGNQADISGDTHVNICAKYDDSTEEWVIVPEGSAGVSIDKNDAAGGSMYDGSVHGGSVYGGGCSADVLGNTNVRMSGGYVFNGIFGGGYAGSVGTFDQRDKTLTTDNFDHSTHSSVCLGKPTHCEDGTGKCTVVVDGGQIGPIQVATEGMTGNNGPVIQGWVWGGGQGLIEDPEVEHDTHFKSYVGSTDVTIGGTAFILESIIGGGEFGRVLGDTKVTITGNCQIGVGEGMVDGNNKPIRYTDGAGGTVNQFIDPTSGVTSEQALAACSHFPYGENIGTDEAPNWVYLPYDPYYETCTAYVNSHPDLRPASTSSPSDGKTWIGCVFAGGSGYMPYEIKDGNGNIIGYDWCSSAGLVEGDTELIISGGHILTNVYGGNEVTNVKGKCKITMTGGTIGVPRTLQQILDHPVICNLFGAGKGDQRKHFNKETNVGDVEVEITGGIIYGSVFGGGEDGHVLRDVTVTIGDDEHNGPKIGTWGTSYMDGNVFGGGRGFGGDAYTAGNVAGSVDLDIKGGNILGSVYGGGRLGSVGYGLFNATTGGSPTPGYGEMREDTDTEAGFTDGTTGFFTHGRGHIDITISGGTIGNNWEYKNVPTDVTDLAAWKTTNHIPNTEYGSDNRLKHTKGGNVFAGGMGRLYQLDGTTPITDVDWWRLGCVKSTKLTITGGTIKSNVYGGGELGQVVGYHTTKNAANEDINAGTEIIIQNVNNTTIGTEIKDGSNNTQYTFGSVFGGGYGSLLEGVINNVYPKLIAGLVKKDTKIDMQAGEVKASIYGGGEMASVGESTTSGETTTVTGSTYVAVSDGTVGIAPIEVSGTNRYFGGATMGNVYGGGSGDGNTVRSGKIFKNTNVTISGSSTRIYHNIYGGGAYGTVGDFTYEVDDNNKVIGVNGHTSDTGVTTVTITGGTIGVDGHENGMVFGSSRGDINKPGERDDYTAWVYDTYVTIGETNGSTNTPLIKGSVYGSGENGHTFNNTDVKVHSGTIGVTDDASYLYRGNVYGGGCGTDKYYSNHAQETHDGNGQLYNPLAGIVYGNTTVTIDGGTVVRNVYGAGAMGSVGLTDTSGAIIQDGTTTIAINGGKIGVDGTKGDGNVYGAARGDFDSEQTHLAQVSSTSVSMSDGTVYGNVYGGGEAGDVGTYTNTYTETGSKNYVWDIISEKEIGACAVEITGGTVKGHVFGAGKGKASTFECEKAMVRTATVSISAGTVEKNVYGGGEVGRVDQDSKVALGVKDQAKGSAAPTVKGNVFGAGAGKDTHGYSALVRGNTEVILQGNTKVEKSVYGGGEIAAVGRYGLDGLGMPTTLVSGGECKVTVKGYADIGENVFGAGEGVVPAFVSGESKRMDNTGGWEIFTDRAKYLAFLQTLALATDTKLSIEGNATVNGSVYGGSESGFVQRDTEVKIQGATGTDGSVIDGNIYGGGKGLATFAEAGRVNGGVTIDVSGSTTRGSVYGGGELGIVVGAVKVDINNGTVEKDVYGGGALANTNTNNWDGNTLTETYLEVAGLTVGTSSVVGYYTKSGDTYNEATGTAEENTKYYRKVNTTVNLLGGTIEGDAYGGGLGQLEVRSGETVTTEGIPAMVYGDVFVKLGDDPDNPTTATAFNISTLTDNSDTSKPVEVVNSGRVFGCNNLNGSPKGNVTVTVNKTLRRNAQGEALAKPTLNTHTYEVAAVYGGGNLADYVATGSGKKSNVIINSCDVSIEEVYGGGNAAAVPETDVLVMGAYEIENVFGGGNGEDNYTLDGGTTWKTNPGANVNGNATTLLRGGYIHAGYGGSNSRGTISGNVSIDKGIGGRCTLNVTEIYGAGKDADVEGDLILIMGCSETRTEAVYGCSMNANVKGNVELTITSGEYGKVFGGNNQSGAIFGHIIVNVEETGCSPIIIDELYGCGNDAAYSTYGYYQDGTLANGKPKYVARTSATDTHPYVYFGNNDETDHTKPPYADPEVNIISCTRIGKVFGGGLGSNAIVYGNPKVNINMIKGVWANRTYKEGTSDERAVPDELGKVGDGYIDATTSKIVEGGVFGGGNEAKVEGNTTVNIGTAQSVSVFKLDNENKPIPTSKTDDTPQTESKTVAGANITQNVYGGGNQADVTGNTYVNVCAVKDATYTTTDVIGYKGVTISGTDYEGVVIKGDVFGGGKGITEAAGVTGAFECAKAMVGVVDSNDGKTDIMKESIDKGTRVSIGNGTVEGSVYGGGEVGRVEWNGVVTIGLPIGTGETSAPEIKRDVFGGGKGVEQYGYAALMRGNTFVTIQANAKVGKSVYGGGEIASVGKYKVATQDDINNSTFMAAHPGIEKDMPYSLGNEKSGYCNVIVRGNAEIGPDNMKMYHDDGKAPEDEGHVFGAGKGVLPYENEDDFECQYEGHNGAKHPGRMGPGNAWDCYNDQETKYLRFIETQALATHTEVLVDGNAFVKGSVYGGSLSGHVQHDTHVTITGDCQIGAGDGINERYTTHYNVTKWPTDIQTLETSWAECAHWTMDVNNIMPYDPYAKHYNSEDGKYYYDTDFTDPNNNSYGGSSVATDGHTYYGNVFGGGSGVVPYKPGKWHREAGTVGGNTVVDITGGHILTSVYGGNECTDVGTYDPSNRALLAGTGKCIINMTGGTVGVPRTKEDIAAHPMTCCVYGGGKGDQRVSFNKWTNVGETEVNITKEARIYGSVFGGGEDGHVLGNAVTNIGGSVTIGSTTYTHPTTTSNTDPGVIIGSQGRSGADGNVFGGGRGFSEDALTAGVVCGNVTLNIHDGKVLGSVYGGGRLASVGTHLAGSEHANYGTLIPNGKNQVIGSTDETAEGATHGIINIIIAGGTIGATDSDGKLLTSSSSIGDVFGGCRGAGSDKRFGLAKKTTVTMTAGTVKGNVYGGGELGYVGEATLNSSNIYEWNEEAAGGGLCTVGISGGTVAGNVFGAGKGLADDFDCEKALVRTTNVTISGTGTSVGGNVYGGGEVGRVDQDTEVTIGNGDGTNGGAAAPTITGNVFGAGAGVETHGYSALVRGNATVTVQGNASVGHNVYGGGMIASVGQYGLDSNFMPETLKGGGDCRVTVKGYSVIGASGEGHVFGAGMGINPFDAAHNYINYTNDSENPNNKKTKPKRMTKRPAADKMPALWDPVGDGSEYIWEYYTSQDNYFKFLQTLALATDSYATIDGNATVKGNVYGGGESGFVQRETDVKIQGSGKILTVTDTNTNTTTDGNVFGGGRGVSGFDLAGRVRGNAKTTISGSSTVNGNVYGGGELGFVGKFAVSANGRNYDWQKIKNQQDKEEETGTCTVIINSATAEVKGDVFGAGKGEAITFKCEPAMTRTTSVSVNAGTVDGNVYGGGEVGRVDENTVVTIGAATGESAPDIKGSVFGAGAGLGTHGYSALVRGNTYVTVQNHAAVGHSVYGGGEIASVGKYGLDDQKMPSVLLGGGYCYVKVKGDATISGDVFGAGQGITPNFDKDNADRAKRPRRMTMYTNNTDFPSTAMLPANTGEASGTTTQGTTWEYYETGSPYIWEYFREESGYLTYLETLALATHPEVTIEGNASIGNDVYGGGERGIAKGSVIVNINGGTITRDVYGGGALANTNTTSTVGNEDYNTGVITTTTVAPTTTVNLHGGIIGRNVFGGGLGQKYKAAVAAQPAVEGHGEVGDEDYVAAQPAIAAQPEMPAIAALVYGDVLVKLNETPTVTNNVASFPDNCVVKGVIHGANNYNGSPQGDVTVHIYKTMARDAINKKSQDKDGSSYDLKAVYGGGNEAAYDPIEPNTRKAHVIIEGCGDTSIETVYGGGNAAAAPATHVEVNSCYEIGTVFAGGNGKDAMEDGSENPGADVGLIALKTGGTPYENDHSKQAYGTGIALAEIHGGFVHSAFGGSNTKGNVRESATVDLSEPDVVTCPLGIDEAYGAGNEAAQDGTSNINLGCLSYLREIYGGAKNADVNNDIVLNIQSGRFHRVFGGNNIGGKIDGSITVNIEETGCHPIVIGQLFGGGNQAGYSVYGYKDVNGKWVPRESATDSGEGPTTPYRDPLVNVRSFTSIGEIYGGGFGNSAVIVGNPTVDINVCDGNSAAVDITGDWKDQNGNVVDENVKVSANTSQWIRIKVAEGEYNTVWQPEHKSGAIGTIGNVFGGGNAAPVHGNTNVYIGTKNSVVFETPKKKPDTTNGGEMNTTVEDRTHIVKGANITGNVYGGGNAADVSGDTNVVIGKEKN